MAWLERDPSPRFHVCFRFGGNKYRRSLRTSNQQDASTRLNRLEENIRLVESGRLEIPPNADAATFLLSDGKIIQAVQSNKSVFLASLFDRFFDSLPETSLEPSTIEYMNIHRRHLERHLGKRFRLNSLSLEKLQDYVTRRSREPGKRGRTIGGSTIKKELTTFRSLWQWGVKRELLSGDFPKDGIRLPMDSEKPPFQTWKEIEKQIARGSLLDNEIAELWSSLFLSLEEIESVLRYIKQAETQPFVHPMFTMAAHTGARRSELIRSQISDIDVNAVLIREKKRVRSKSSFRRVPMSESLHKVMCDWLDDHPGGPYTFCKVDTTPLTRHDARNYFENTLSGSDWSNIPGWHCFRHSFISNCAMKGVDQRVIDTWVGHQTDEMRRRYRHLFPDIESDAIRSVFN